MKSLLSLVVLLCITAVAYADPQGDYNTAVTEYNTQATIMNNLVNVKDVVVTNGVYTINDLSPFTVPNIPTNISPQLRMELMSIQAEISSSLSLQANYAAGLTSCMKAAVNLQAQAKALIFRCGPPNYELMASYISMSAVNVYTAILNTNDYFSQRTTTYNLIQDFNALLHP